MAVQWQQQQQRRGFAWAPVFFFGAIGGRPISAGRRAPPLCFPVPGFGSRLWLVHCSREWGSRAPCLLGAVCSELADWIGGNGARSRCRPLGWTLRSARSAEVRSRSVPISAHFFFLSKEKICGCVVSAFQRLLLARAQTARRPGR